MKSFKQILKYNNSNGYSSGQAMIMAVLFFTVASFFVVIGAIFPILQDIESTRVLIDSKQSFYYASGLMEDVSYRIMTGMNLSSEEHLVKASGEVVATSTIVTNSDSKEVNVRGDVNKAVRKLYGKFVEGDGVSFNYGVQSGEGGVKMEDSSSIKGNLFSNGPVTGASNIVGGDVISAGPSGLIDDIHATGSAYAHTIEDSYIEKDAYYYDNNITSTTVEGDLYPNSSDQPTSTLPISDEKIAEWESGAEDGGVINTCPYEISSDTTIGPVKIDCDLSVSGNTTVTLGGNVWVVGNITIGNQADFKIDSSLEDKSLSVIAHDPNATSTKGIIEINNNTTFDGSGHSDSYIMFVSQNNSAETGGSEEAIKLKNGGEGKILLYASHGEIEIANNVSLKEVTAYKINTKNNTEVIYESGLADLLFSTGPSGGFSIESLKEVE